MAEKNEFSLKGKLTPIGVAFYIAPFVNAMTRSGTLEEKTLLFDSMLKYKAFIELPSTKRGHAIGQKETLVDQAVRVATNVKNRQTKAQDDFLTAIETMIEKQNLLDHKVLLFLMNQGEIDKNIAGLVANKIMAKYQRPVCILTKYTKEQKTLNPDLPWDEYEYKYYYAGSARGCDKVDIDDFKQICLDTGVCNYAEGHPNAFGLSIDEDNISTFITKTDEALADISTEPVYYVDYIYDGNHVNSNNILDIAYLEELWGKDLDEPLVAIQNLKITPEMVTIYTKKDYTVKITLNNNLALLKFKATQEDCQFFQYRNFSYVVVDIVGKCNKNEWNGWTTPQIFIEQYQIAQNNKYTF